jgi:hypothetical protein
MSATYRPAAPMFKMRREHRTERVAVISVEESPARVGGERGGRDKGGMAFWWAGLSRDVCPRSALKGLTFLIRYSNMPEYSSGMV